MVQFTFNKMTVIPLEYITTSGVASVDTEPQYMYWKNLKFLLDVDRSVRETVLSSLTNSPVGYTMLYHEKRFYLLLSHQVDHHHQEKDLEWLYYMNHVEIWQQ